MYKKLFILIVLIGNACAISADTISLPKCTDPNIIMDLQKVLNSYHYTHKYDDEDFNCVDLTTACVQFLDKRGYNTAIMAYLYGINNTSGHCYPVVNFGNKGWLAIETSYSKTTGFKLGYVTSTVKGNKYNYLTGMFLNNTTELNDFDAGPDPIYKGDLTRFIAINN
jgi:hypothetical protein